MQTVIILVPKMDWDLDNINAHITGKIYRNLSQFNDVVGAHDYEYHTPRAFNDVLNTEPSKLQRYWVSHIILEEPIEEPKRKMGIIEARGILANAVKCYGNVSDDKQALTDLQLAWETHSLIVDNYGEMLENAYAFVTRIEACTEQTSKGNIAYDTFENEGTGGVMDLAAEWSEEFTLKYVDHEFDGDFDDKVEEFINDKQKKYDKVRK